MHNLLIAQFRVPASLFRPVHSTLCIARTQAARLLSSVYGIEKTPHMRLVSSDLMPEDKALLISGDQVRVLDLDGRAQ